MRQLILTLMIPVLLCMPAVATHAQEQQMTMEHGGQQKAEYEKSMQARLGRVGKKLDELKAKAASQAGETRKDINKYIAEAENKGKSAEGELAKLRKATNDKWEALKPKINGAVHDFEQAFEKARSRFQDK